MAVTFTSYNLISVSGSCWVLEGNFSKLIVKFTKSLLIQGSINQVGIHSVSPRMDPSSNCWQQTKRWRKRVATWHLSSQRAWPYLSCPEYKTCLLIQPLFCLKIKFTKSRSFSFKTFSHQLSTILHMINLMSPSIAEGLTSNWTN